MGCWKGDGRLVARQARQARADGLGQTGQGGRVRADGLGRTGQDGRASSVKCSMPSKDRHVCHTSLFVGLCLPCLCHISCAIARRCPLYGSASCSSARIRSRSLSLMQAHGYICSTKKQHHYFPALVTWSVMENNLSDFMQPCCLTSACPPRRPPKRLPALPPAKLCARQKHV